MREKLNELKSKCTTKEAKFLELLITGEEKFNAYKQAGFRSKNAKVASAAVCRLLKKVSCSAYFEALKAENDRELQRKTAITRSTQLNALIAAKDLAERLRNPSAMVSAIREMNEMLGYHRDKAPNPEAAAARMNRIKGEMDILRQIGRERTKQLSMVPEEDIIDITATEVDITDPVKHG